MDIRKQREEQILAQACAVIREQGFHNARMADIAKKAGVSYGLVYHYYKNKDALFDAILEKWWSGLHAMMENGLPGERSINEKLGGIIDYFLDQYELNRDLVHIFIAEVSRSTANLTPERLAAFKNWIALTERLFVQAQKSGGLRSDIKARYLSTYFLGALETMLSTMVLDNQPISGQAMKQRIRSSLLEQFFFGAAPKTSGR